MWTGIAQSRPVTSGSPLKISISSPRCISLPFLHSNREKQPCPGKERQTLLLQFFPVKTGLRIRAKPTKTQASRTAFQTPPPRAMSFPKTGRGVTRGSRKEKSSFRFSPVPTRAGPAQRGTEVSANPCRAMRSRQLPWLPKQSGGVTQGAPGRAEGETPGSAAPRAQEAAALSASLSRARGTRGVSRHLRQGPRRPWHRETMAGGRGAVGSPQTQTPPLSLLSAAFTGGCTREQSPLSYSGLSAVPPVQPPRPAPAAAARTWQGREKGPERGWACASCARARSAVPGPPPPGRHGGSSLSAVLPRPCLSHAAL